MKRLALAVLLALSTTTAHALPLPTAARLAATPFGLWQNPKGTLLVRTRVCGQELCGNIVWASGQALADAKDAGVNALVGTELLSGYHPSGTNRWTGQVYVPDQGRRFYSTIQLENSDSLRISGCILGGLICKHQEWTRR